jgi:hypothetical protein
VLLRVRIGFATLAEEAFLLCSSRESTALSNRFITDLVGRNNSNIGLSLAGEGLVCPLPHAVGTRGNQAGGNIAGG